LGFLSHAREKRFRHLSFILAFRSCLWATLERGVRRRYVATESFSMDDQSFHFAAVASGRRLVLRSHGSFTLFGIGEVNDYWLNTSLNRNRCPRLVSGALAAAADMKKLKSRLLASSKLI